MVLHDYSNAEPSGLYYGGHAGRKVGVLVDGAPYLLKFPESTREFSHDRLASYTTSHISEWLGSHVYESLGIPVHETHLGLYNGTLVCACKDFTFPGKRLIEFLMIRNSMDDGHSSGFEQAPSTGSGVVLTDILETIAESPALHDVPGVLARFWDMFIVDTFIGNADRNNANWGLLADSKGTALAPVYDNGNSFFNRKRHSEVERQAQRGEDLAKDAMGSARSIYLTRERHHVSPFKVMAEGSSPECTAALERFLDHVDLTEIDKLIDSIPETAYGSPILPDAVRELYRRTL